MGLFFPQIKMFKVGTELYYRYGPVVVDWLHGKGGKVFLDLKLHDIPQTVSRTSRVLTRLGVEMFNLHVSGGLRMLTAACEAVKEESQALKMKPPLLLGVTLLTSLEASDLERLGLSFSLEEFVLKQAGLAWKVGLAGVIASGKEARVLREAYGKGFLIVTPGICLPGAPAGDQKRTVTPAEAFQAGADYLVLGRAITAALDPQKALAQVLASLKA